MGFYQPAQLVIDARKHRVEVRPVDINSSHWDNTLEEQAGPYRAVRLGFRQVKGLREEDMQLLLAGRETSYRNINDLLDVGVSRSALERLADADAFRSIGLDRRQALWKVSALHDHPTGIFTGTPSENDSEGSIELPSMAPGEHVIRDYASTSLSLKAHPVSFVRWKLDQLQVAPTSELSKMKNGMAVKVCGLITVRQRPGTAKGVLFITIEDETGFANLVVWQKTFEKYRKEILQSRLLMVAGKLQVEGEVIHVVVNSCYNLNGLMRLDTEGRNIGSVHKPARPDEKNFIENTGTEKTFTGKPVQGNLFPSRDFK
jgi:error-prone DNA polymerase